MKLISFLLLIFVFSPIVYSDDDQESSDFARGLLATGKFSGGCGIFKLQIEFQENTQLAGGSEFIARFWTTEAARLGMSLEEYAEQCKTVVQSYKDYETMFQPSASN